MTKEIKKVAVIGAGVMGSGIAAHLANAGIQVHLLDIVPKGAADRNVIANGAIERMKKANPADPMNAGFMDTANARLITPGNTEDNLAEAVKDADWVIEVVLEDLDIKRNLFAKLDALKKPGAVVSSNTSTIPLHDLTEGRSDDFKKNFLITHFFNPPRFMRLLELVSGKDTDPAVTDAIKDFCDVRLGKKVIECNDTPAFIANRIGTYFSFRTLSLALEMGVKVEDADAVLGRPMGFPKDGVFGLTDIVGLKLIPHLTASLKRTLPENDAFRAIDGVKALQIIDDMIAADRTGRSSKNKEGFYRPKKNDKGETVKDAKGKTALQSWNLEKGGYQDVSRVKSPAVEAGKRGPRAVFEAGDYAAEFAWKVMRDTLLYAGSLVGVVSDNISDIDAAMREGYNWKWGPFELLDKIGLEWFVERAKKDGCEIPPALELANNHKFHTVLNGQARHMVFDFKSGAIGYKADVNPEGVLKLSDVKLRGKPLLENDSASAWDVGDGVVCFEFHSKMNSIDASILHGLSETIKLINGSGGKYKALVLYNEGDAFSAGANLGVISAGFQAARNPALKKLHLAGPLDRAMTNTVENMVHYGQAVYKALREAPFPVVGAPNGLALGGGCEILLHCDSVQAGAETYMALVESGVGVIPGWGGCVRMLERFQNAANARKGPFASLRQTFLALMVPQVSASAQDAKKKMWMRPQDGITMNKDRLLADAKAKALTLVPGYEPPKPAQFRLPGRNAKMALMTGLDDFYNGGQATYHDVVVGEALANVLTGGDTHVGKTLTEDDLRHLERENFMSLIATRETRARIAFMLANNKPLREGPPKQPKTLDEIRAARVDAPLPRRPLDGKPVEGDDEKTLRRIAWWTAYAMRKFG